MDVAALAVTKQRERERRAGSNVAVGEGAPPPITLCSGNTHRRLLVLSPTRGRLLSLLGLDEMAGFGAEEEYAPTERLSSRSVLVAYRRTAGCSGCRQNLVGTGRKCAVQGTLQGIMRFGASSPWFGPLMRHLTQLCKGSRHMLVLFEEQQDKWYFRPAALARRSARVDRLLQDAMGVIANARQE